jgi:fatty acid desaturase
MCVAGSEHFESQKKLILPQDFASERTKSDGDRWLLQNVYQRRPMSLLERQRGAVTYVNGVAKPNRSRLRFWRAMLIILPVILVVFFGVGLIGSTQEFSPYFVKQYFVIAVAWSLCSSGILASYIRLFGGTKTEAAAGFLAFMGLWLVVMQVIPNPLVQESWNLSR